MINQFALRKKIIISCLIILIFNLFILDNSISTNPGSTLKGDGDENSTVDIDDAIRIRQFVVGKASLTTQGQKNADVNSDNKVDIADAMLVGQIVRSLRPAPPHITSITPNTGAPGTIVIIEGTGLSGEQKGNIIRFNSINVIGIPFGDNKLLGVIPVIFKNETIFEGNINVAASVNNGLFSNFQDFDVLALPSPGEPPGIIAIEYFTKSLAFIDKLNSIFYESPEQIPQEIKNALEATSNIIEFIQEKSPEYLTLRVIWDGIVKSSNLINETNEYLEMLQILFPAILTNANNMKLSTKMQVLYLDLPLHIKKHPILYDILGLGVEGPSAESLKMALILMAIGYDQLAVKLFLIPPKAKIESPAIAQGGDKLNIKVNGWSLSSITALHLEIIDDGGLGLNLILTTDNPLTPSKEYLLEIPNTVAQTTDIRLKATIVNNLNMVGQDEKKIKIVVPDIEVSPLEFDVSLEEGHSEDLDFTIENNGDGILLIKQIVSYNAFITNLSDNPHPENPIIIEPEDLGHLISFTIDASNLQGRLEPYNGTINIISDDPDEGEIAVTVVLDVSDTEGPTITMYDYGWQHPSLSVGISCIVEDPSGLVEVCWITDAPSRGGDCPVSASGTGCADDIYSTSFSFSLGCTIGVPDATYNCGATEVEFSVTAVDVFGNSSETSRSYCLASGAHQDCYPFK